MRYFILTGFILFSLNTFAQFTPDYRNKRESLLRLGDRNMRAEAAAFTLTGISEGVGDSKLQKIAPTQITDSSMSFEGNGIKITVTTAGFDPGAHRLYYLNKKLLRIDNRPYYGNYGDVPATQIKKIEVLVGKDTVVIPPVAWADLFNINFVYTAAGRERTLNAVYHSVDNSTIYLYLLSKDNKGSYEVTFAILDKHYVRRILDYGFL